MASIDRRLRRLESGHITGYTVAVTKLRSLSDEDLDALEAEVEDAVSRGARPFWDLYAVVTVKSKRAIDGLLRESDSRQESEDAELASPGTVSEIWSGQNPGHRQGAYRIWRYHRKEMKMPENLRRELYGTNEER